MPDIIDVVRIGVGWRLEATDESGRPVRSRMSYLTRGRAERALDRGDEIEWVLR